MNVRPLVLFLVLTAGLSESGTVRVSTAEQNPSVKSNSFPKQWRKDVEIRIVNAGNIETETPASFDFVFWKSKKGKDSLDAVIDLATSSGPGRRYRDQTANNDCLVLLLSGKLETLDTVTLASVAKHEESLVCDIRIRLRPPEEIPSFDPGEAVVFILLPTASIPDRVQSLDVRITCHGRRVLPNAGLPSRVTLPIR